MTTEPIEPVQILLVEDSPADVSLTTEALRATRVANDLAVVGDGDAALAYLRRQDPFADAPRPDLVLLDLNLPRRSGQEVLAEMKQDEALRSIPVVVLTTSARDADVRAAYRGQAAGFVTKPVALDDFLQAIAAIEGFWLSVVRYPPH